MPPSVTIRSLPRAFELVKGVGDGYRALSGQALAGVLREQMGLGNSKNVSLRSAGLCAAPRRCRSHDAVLLAPGLSTRKVGEHCSRSSVGR